MARLSDHLINETKLNSVKEFQVTCNNSDVFTVGVRDPEGITWREKKRLAKNYGDVDVNSEKANINLEKGDESRYLAFIKYIKDDDGVHNMSKMLLEQLPEEIINEVENHIPTIQDVFKGLSEITKKKLRT